MKGPNTCRRPPSTIASARASSVARSAPPHDPEAHVVDARWPLRLRLEPGKPLVDHVHAILIALAFLLAGVRRGQPLDVHPVAQRGQLPVAVHALSFATLWPAGHHRHASLVVYVLCRACRKAGTITAPVRGTRQTERFPRRIVRAILGLKPTRPGQHRPQLERSTSDASSRHPACYIPSMNKRTTIGKTTAASRSKAAPLAATPSRIRPAATKPVKTTLSDIRRAVRKSFEEHPVVPDA